MDATAETYVDDSERPRLNEVEREVAKRSLAFTFDRLAEANLALVTAVRGLVRVSYFILAINSVVVILILTLILRR
jgi:hypothetical protein